MEQITLSSNTTDGLGFQVNELCKIINAVSNDESQYTLDFSNVPFLHPTFILGISSLISVYSKVGITFNIINASYNVQNYLDTVKFPHGLYPDLETDWNSKLEEYRHKNFLPIIGFSTSKKSDSTTFRNAVLSKVNELIAHKLDLRLSEVGDISYFISEFTDNIVDHANVLRGKIMVQYFPQKEFLEVCILDEGKTILGSYLEARTFSIVSDTQAIQAAISGRSTKSKERGYGIPTSTNLIVNGLNGNICIMTGKGLLADRNIIDSPASWPGTLLSVKIPKRRPKDWMAYI
jgi:anti-sigma regulatory factor (Ser/Thr protein kinase)